MRGAHAARAALLTISLGWSGVVPAGHAGPQPAAVPAVLAELGPARMPGGMVRLCARDPSFCRPAAARGQALALTPDRRTQLARINQLVNARITSTTDEKLYGQAEYWTIPSTAGDCEDYVLLKRQMLMALGVPEASLLITVVHDENGDGHAVLTVPTADGDLVLDNRRGAILHWWATGYKFIKRQSEADPLRWVSLGHDRLQATNLASGPEAQ